jgi:hypothetical protein
VSSERDDPTGVFTLTATKYADVSMIEMPKNDRNGGMV